MWSMDFINILDKFIMKLTRLCLASHKRDIDKQCRLRQDATERGV